MTAKAMGAGESPPLLRWVVEVNFDFRTGMPIPGPEMGWERWRPFPAGGLSGKIGRIAASCS